jgi:hypothetical protein
VRVTPAVVGLAVLPLLAAAAARAAEVQAAPPPAVAARVVPGELARVDLARRSVTVKTEGREAREVEAETGASTRVISRGRALRFEDLHPGDRVTVACARAEGACDALVIRVSGRAAGLPAPSPSTVPPTTSNRS